MTIPVDEVRTMLLFIGQLSMNLTFIENLRSLQGVGKVCQVSYVERKIWRAVKFKFTYKPSISG